MPKTKKTLLADFLLPTVLIIGSKYVSVFIFNLVLFLDWRFAFSAYQVFTIPFIQYKNQTDLIMVSSFSTLIMTMVLAVGYSLALYRFQYFHEKFITPKLAARLYSKKKEHLIFQEARAHNQITVWFALAWSTFLVTLLGYLGGTIVLFVVLVNLVIVLLLSSATIFDMHKKSLTLKEKSK